MTPSFCDHGIREAVGAHIVACGLLGLLLTIAGSATAQPVALSRVFDGEPEGYVIDDEFPFGILGFGDELDGRLLFGGYTEATGREPWVTDGTTAGTYPLADTFPGPGSGYGIRYGNIGGAVYFVAGNGLYRWDGSDELIHIEGPSGLFFPIEFQGSGYLFGSSTDELYRVTEQRPFFQEITPSPAGDGDFSSPPCATDSTLYVLRHEGENAYNVVPFDGSSYGTPLALPQGIWRLIGAPGSACYLMELQSASNANDVVRLARFTDAGLEFLPVSFDAILTFTMAQVGDDSYFIAFDRPGDRPIERALYRVSQELAAPERVLDDVDRYQVVGGRLYFTTPDSVYLLTESDEIRLLLEGDIRQPVFLPYEDQVAIFNSGEVWLTRGTPESTVRILARPAVGRSFQLLGSLNGGIIFTDRLIDDARNTYAESGDLFRLAPDRGADESLTGSWVSTGYNDQGVLIQAGQRDDGSRFVFAAWFLFEDGEAAWVAGNVDYQLGDPVVEIPMERLAGLGTINEAPGSFAVRDPIGTVTIHSMACDEFTLDYALDGIGIGALSMQRLAPSSTALPCLR